MRRRTAITNTIDGACRVDTIRDRQRRRKHTVVETLRVVVADRRGGGVRRLQRERMAVELIGEGTAHAARVAREFVVWREAAANAGSARASRRVFQPVRVIRVSVHLQERSVAEGVGVLQFEDSLVVIEPIALIRS